jgi:hypothetical protein
MVTGSVASSLYGEPRSTHDIDLVVQIHEPDIAPLLAAFPSPRFYVSESAAHQALAQGGMFNMLDTQGGSKVDFWSLGDAEYDVSAFQRRRAEQFGGEEILFAAPEDVVLSKLRWAKLSGGSEKHLTDALRVYELQHGILDEAYLSRWIARLELMELWSELLRRAKPLE